MWLVNSKKQFVIVKTKKKCTKFEKSKKSKICFFKILEA